MKKKCKWLSLHKRQGRNESKPCKWLSFISVKERMKQKKCKWLSCINVKEGMNKPCKWLSGEDELSHEKKNLLPRAPPFVLLPQNVFLQSRGPFSSFFFSFSRAASPFLCICIPAPFLIPSPVPYFRECPLERKNGEPTVWKLGSSLCRRNVSFVFK